MWALGDCASIPGPDGRPIAAWWVRRTYYLFQMPRWDRRLRIVLDWTVALLFRPDITKVELEVERNAVRREQETAASIDARRSTPPSPP